ncbi:MAG TPA: deoxyribonuclease V [Methylococcaceae bacterium]|nr:deoxyribonuclease V [Methylococcaceae bacterium]
MSPAADLVHPWDLTPRDAIALQKRLRERVVAADDLPKRIEYIAGVDVGFEDDGRVTRAAVAVLRYPELTLADHAVARLPTAFPYVPGLLSFRELPAVLEAIRRLSIRPDLFLCDGQGLAHPRRFGIACHLGVLLDAPSIGVAKTRLCGTFREPPERRGFWSPLQEHGEVIGAVLRTRERVKPLFVSVGHRLALETAIHWVLACTTRYRLPETTRQAHRLASG